MCTRPITKTGELLVGDTVFGHTVSKNIIMTEYGLIQCTIGNAINAKVEQLNSVWIPKGASRITSEDRIEQIRENGSWLSIPAGSEIYQLAVYDGHIGRNILKLLTRPSGDIYKNITGHYPPFCDEKRAELERGEWNRQPLLVPIAGNVSKEAIDAFEMIKKDMPLLKEADV